MSAMPARTPNQNATHEPTLGRNLASQPVATPSAPGSKALPKTVAGVGAAEEGAVAGAGPGEGVGAGVGVGAGARGASDKEFVAVVEPAPAPVDGRYPRSFCSVAGGCVIHCCTFFWMVSV